MPTLSYKNDNREDERLSPYEGDASHSDSIDPKDLQNMEQQSAYDRDFDDMVNNNPSLRDDEESGSGHTNNYTGKKRGASPRNIKTILKRGGPIGLIVGGLLGTAGIISFFGGPGLLIVNVAEIIQDKFNTQIASSDARFTKIVQAKLKNTTKGICTKIGSVGCKYSTFSDKEIENFRRNGIEPVVEGKTLTGRNRISALTFNQDMVIDANNLNAMRRAHPNFASALNASYGATSELPKGGSYFATLYDKIAKKMFKKWGASRAPPFKDGSTDKERDGVVQERATDERRTGRMTAAAEDCGNDCTDEQRAANEANSRGAELDNTISEVADQSDGDTIKDGLSKIGKSVNVLGVTDTACSFLGLSKGVSRATKLIKKRKMLAVGMLIMVTGQRIKAGQETPDNASYIGKKLTEVMRRSDGGLTKSATDSAAYRNAAYGDTDVDQAAVPYILGSGLSGDEQNAFDEVLKIVGGAAAVAATCKFVKNPFVSAGATVLGGLAILVPGANLVQGAKFAIQASLAIAVGAASATLIDKLANIRAGNLIAKDTTSEDIGNMSFIALADFMSNDLAGAGGNAILTPEQQIAYQQTTNQYLAHQARIDRYEHSPLDISNQNTFMGSLVRSTLPYTEASIPLSSRLSRVAAMVPASLRQFTSPASAVSADDYNKCKDIDVQALGIAATPMCAVMRGIPQKYLDIDPDVVAEQLSAAGLLDLDTDELKGEAVDFYKTCIDRDLPIGDTGDDFQTDSGINCPIREGVDSGKFKGLSADIKGYIYVNRIDNRSADILENGVTMESEAPSSGTAQTDNGGTVPASADFGNLGESSENIQCAPGTRDLGVTDGAYFQGNKMRARLCAVSGMKSTSEDSQPGSRHYQTGANGEAIVNSRISANYVAMINAIKAAGTDKTMTNMYANSTFRTMAHQEFLFANNPNPAAVARPGRSNHQSGYATDFNMGPGNPISIKACNTVGGICTPPVKNGLYDWLVANAGKYGFKQYNKEYWHWSPTGG